MQTSGYEVEGVISKLLLGHSESKHPYASTLIKFAAFEVWAVILCDVHSVDLWGLKPWSVQPEETTSRTSFSVRMGTASSSLFFCVCVVLLQLAYQVVELQQQIKIKECVLEERHAR